MSKDRKIQTYMMLSKALTTISTRDIIDSIRDLIESINLDNTYIIFPHSTALFNFIRGCTNMTLQSKLRAMYHNGSIMTSKNLGVDTLPNENINKAIIINHFEMDIDFIKRLHERSTYPIYSFILNPDLLDAGKLNIPYGDIVSGIITQDASDDNLLIMLSLQHFIKDHSVIKYHIKVIRQFLSQFDECVYKSIVGDFKQIRSDFI